MKKILYLLFIVLLALALSACGGDGPPPVEDLFDTAYFDSYAYLLEQIDMPNIDDGVRAAWTQDGRIFFYHIVFDVEDHVVYGSTVVVTSFLPSGRRLEHQEFPGDVAGWEAFSRAHGAFLPEWEHLAPQDATATRSDWRLVGLVHLLPAWEDATFDLLMDDGRYLFGYNLQTGVRTPILNWLETGLADLQDAHIVFLDDGRIFVLSQNFAGYEGFTTELFILTPTPRAGLPERITITLGGFALSHYIASAVLEFNRESHTHFIQVIDYSRYNTEDDWSAGFLRFQMDLITGGGPDIIYNADETMADAGLLIDLYPFLDADRTLDRADLFPNVLSALEARDGTLPFITNRFSIRTMIGQTQTVGHIDTWTVSDLLALMETPAPYPLGFWMCGENFIFTIMPAFIDWYAMEAHFDSEVFVQSLDVARRLPASAPDTVWAHEFVSQYVRMLEGEQLLSVAFLGGTGPYREYSAALGDISALGMPTATGGAHEIVFASSRMGINAASDHALAAWSIVRQLLLPTMTVDEWGFPLRIDLYESHITELMEAPIEERWIGGFAIELLAMTEAEAQSLRAMIDSARPGGRFDGDLWALAREELLPFFVGDRTAEDAARIIQNRVQTYLAERGR